MPLAWHDLLGVPWKLHGIDHAGMDCSTVAEEIVRRTGATPPATSPFRLATSAGGEGEMASYFGYLDDAYERVGEDISEATRAGDLVLTKDEGGVARHLFVLVEPSRGTFLTASLNCGVIAVRRFVIHDVQAVYRIRRSEA